MSKNKRVDVRIVNPAAGCGYTSRKCAERYVRRGLARWVKRDGRDCIEFATNTAVARIVSASVNRETLTTAPHTPDSHGLTSWQTCLWSPPES